MTSRERVFAALAHQQPDRCPVDFWAEPDTIKKLLRYLGAAEEQELYDIFNVDMQFIFPTSKFPEPEILADGSWIDHMGVHRRMVKNDYCSYEEYASSPLGFVEEVKDFEGYDKWPDPAAYDWCGFSEKIGNLHEKRVIKLHAGGIFEYAWALRGFEQFLMDMILKPEIAHYILEKFCVYWCDYIKYAMENAGDKIDVVYTYDDIATQDSLIMSSEMLEEFVYPYHRKINAVIKNFDKKILYHSCGSVITQIDNLSKLPIDILNPIQTRAKGMELQKIKEKWGAILCFHGGIDTQEILPAGSAEEVSEEVRRVISILGKNGGYIMASAHYLQNDTPIENIIAMYDLSLR